MAKQFLLNKILRNLIYPNGNCRANMPMWLYKLMLYFDLPLATHPSEKQINIEQESQGMIKLAHPMACLFEKMFSAIEFSYLSHFFISLFLPDSWFS